METTSPFYSSARWYWLVLAWLVLNSLVHAPAAPLSTKIALATEAYTHATAAHTNPNHLAINASSMQQIYLKAANAEESDHFGWVLALDGNTMLVGAHKQSSDPSGNPDGGASHSGAVYVFVRNAGGSWSQQAYLKASNGEADDYFGWSVALDDDTLVVGAPYEDSSATGGINNNTAADAGAAYVFVRTGSTWSQQAILKASNAEAHDQFGSAVSISGNTIVVGAPVESSSAASTPGDNSASYAGAAYIFVRTGSTWSQQAFLKASNAHNSDLFGSALTLDNDTLVVGAQQQSSSATGGPNDSSASYAGAAYVFVRTGSTWSQQAFLKASNAEASDMFGAALALDKDTLVVGAPQEGHAPSVGYVENTTTHSGAAYVFVRTGSTWSQQAFLKASNPGDDDNFGWSVAISANSILIGSPQESSSFLGGQADNSTHFSGAAYLFVRSGTSWSQQAFLKASNAEEDDNFGTGVAVSGTTILVGASSESSSATGGPGDNSVPFAGAAYVFQSGYILSTARVGTGSGTLTLDPPGASYNAGTVVTVTPKAAPGSHFVGWSGACSGTAICQITMSANKSLTASFSTINHSIYLPAIRKR